MCDYGNAGVTIYVYNILYMLYIYLPLYQFQPVGFGTEFVPNCPTFAAAVQTSSCAASASLGVDKPVESDHH